MASLSTILRDLVQSAVRTASRSARSSDSSSAGDIRMPDLASVDEVRAKRGAGKRDADPDDRPRRPGRPRSGGAGEPSTADAERDRRRMARDDDGVASAGQVGASATVEVDPRTLDPVRTSYNPATDGNPDPGEIVWTWVPYEEADGRGKDRPVVVVARLAEDAVLAVQLSSRDHDGEDGWVGLGAGDWDGEHRPSWANLDRILLVHPGGMRREAAILDRPRFDRLADALARHHRWPH